MKTFDFCGYHWTTAMDKGRIMNSENPWQWYDEDAVYIDEEQGIASLIVYNEKKHIKYYDGREFDPTVATGVMRSEETFGYGRFSAEIKLPQGRNLWPCFWLLGHGSWPENGEIDICEGWTNVFGYLRLCEWKTTTNIHFAADDGTHLDVGCKGVPFTKSTKRPTAHFIKYEVEWTPDAISFFVDGKPLRSYTGNIAKELRDKRMHVIFDLWTSEAKFTLDTDMQIKNFEYKPL